MTDSETLREGCQERPNPDDWPLDWKGQKMPLDRAERYPWLNELRRHVGDPEPLFLGTYYPSTVAKRLVAEIRRGGTLTREWPPGIWELTVKSQRRQDGVIVGLVVAKWMKDASEVIFTWGERGRKSKRGKEQASRYHDQILAYQAALDELTPEFLALLDDSAWEGDPQDDPLVKFLCKVPELAPLVQDMLKSSHATR